MYPPKTAFTSLALASLLFPCGYGKIIDNVDDLPHHDFDFIIVGGGTAGNVVANRLSENPAVNVLVLEAGPTNEGVLEIEVPYLATQVTPGTPWDYNYTTVAQPGLAGRSIPYPRGHVLGGSSSANYMMYTRGSSDDFDRYAAVTRDDGWSWKNMFQYFIKSEKWTLPADNHNITGQFDPSVHGHNGILSVSLTGYPTPIDGRVMQTIDYLGGEFSFNQDMNNGSPLGMGYLQSTIDRAQRSSSAASYLGPEFINRPNLYVLVNVRVSRVLQTSGGSIPAFREIEFYRNDGKGPVQRLTANKEVILSAGAVGTPHILLNSGIGNSRSLQAVGVKPLVDLPDVGQNMTDHPVLGNHWLANSTDTFETPAHDPSVYAEDLALWRNDTGPFIDDVASHVGFMRMPANQTLDGPDPAAGPKSAHYEIFISNGLPIHNVPPMGNFFAIVSVVVSPSSRGTITLASNNPLDAPVINPSLLNTTFDRAVMRQGVKTAKKFAESPYFASYVLSSTGVLANATASDADLDAYVAQNAGTIFHPVGTAAMSARGANHGVVDPDLRVKKVTGLRVVDASIFPYIPSAHTQAPIYAVAERASDLIKASYSL